ncbi:MAG: peptide deformylase [Actinomycetota bacterium]
MAIFSIRRWGDPVLRQRAVEVGIVDDGVRKLMRDMTETMHAAPGVGLAAVQVGILRRVIVWHNEDDAGALANPKIMASSGSIEEDEACLSLPGLTFPVVRAEWVHVQGLDASGEVVNVEASQMTARILQHEIDHLDGVLFIDHISPELQKEAKRRLRESVLSD